MDATSNCDRAGLGVAVEPTFAPFVYKKPVNDTWIRKKPLLISPGPPAGIIARVRAQHAMEMKSPRQAGPVHMAGPLAIKYK